MIAVDVVTEIVIARLARGGGSFAGDIDDTTSWYEKIESVEWKTSPPLVVGSRVAFRR